MSEQAEATASAVTPRLVFDNPINEENAPRFLRKKKPQIREPEQVIEIEPQEPVGLIKTAQSTSLDDLSIDELRKQQQELDRRIQEKQDAERKTVIEQIVHVVNMYQIPIEDIVEALGGLKKPKRKGVKAEPKYQDPVSGITWTGRGKEPLWIRGKDREDFLIK